MSPTSRLFSVAASAAVLALAPVLPQAETIDKKSATATKTAEPAPKPNRLSPATTSKQLDRSGRKQVGKASFYAPMFNGRKMADGTPMNPRDDNAASRTLPLGTTARVTNLETGRSAVVTIQDRGPYVPGRIVDLSPASAEQIGLSKKEGLADVEVVPLKLPEPSVAASDGER
jgi:rare lipoprotein A